MKSESDIRSLIQGVQGATHGFAAGSDPTAQVMALCAPHSELIEQVKAGPVGAVEWLTLVTLAMQILPLIFGPTGFTLDNVKQIIELILAAFGA